jgi:hypothetical protein
MYRYCQSTIGVLLVAIQGQEWNDCSAGVILSPRCNKQQERCYLFIYLFVLVSDEIKSRSELVGINSRRSYYVTLLSLEATH